MGEGRLGRDGTEGKIEANGVRERRISMNVSKGSKVERVKGVRDD